MDWPIGIETFLRLSGTTLGEHGLHQIDIDSVQAADVVGEAMNSCPIGLTTEEASGLLVLTRDAKLVFPTTASDLVAWVDRQAGDFGLPHWFVAFSQCDSSADATATLIETEATLNDRLKELAESPISADEEMSSSCVARSDAISQLEVLSTLRATFPTADAPVTGPVTSPVTRQRFDAIAEEIAFVRGNLPDDDSLVDAVMRALRRRVGNPASCLVADAEDGVIWQNGAGRRAKLTLLLLRKRLNYVPKKSDQH